VPACLALRCLLLAAVLYPATARTAGAVSPDSAAAVAVVEEYNDALRAGSLERVRAVLGPSLIMFNGAHSGDPRHWEVHMYLSGSDLATWPERFVPGAAPHENRLRVLRVNLRGNAALVVTEEIGGNKFRQWSGEVVTYLLGRDGDQWRLVGYFLRDIENPG
jgi:hypothetical protein